MINLHKICSRILSSAILLSCTNASAQSCLPKIAHDSLQIVTNNGIFCTAQKGDTLFFGGDFDYVGKYTGGYAVLNSAGSLISAAARPRVHGDVHCMIPDGSGGFYIGGNFAKIGDSIRTNLAHVNATGQVTAFKVLMHDQPNTQVNALIKIGNKLYIGGKFAYVNNRRRVGVAAISLANGQLTQWDPSANVVNRMIAYKDKIILAGSFSNLEHSPHGTTRNMGMVDTVFGYAANWLPSPDGIVHDLHMDNDTLYVAGEFSSISSQNRTGVASFDMSTGFINLWNPVLTPKAGSTKSYVYAVNTLNDKVYFSGEFSRIASSFRTNIGCVRKTTATVESWYPTITGLTSLIRVKDNNIYIGGSFDSVNNTTRLGLAVLDVSGNLGVWAPHACWDNIYRINDKPISDIVFDNGNTYVVGTINSVGGMARYGLAAIRAKTTEILPFAPQLYLSPSTSNLNRTVKTLKVSGDKLFIGGAFTAINGKAHNHIAGYDLKGDTVMTWNPGTIPGTTSIINSLEVTDGIVYAGGVFTTVNSINRNRLFASDAVTGVVTNWNPGNSSSISQVDVIKENKGNLFIGGNFSSLGAQSRNGVGVVSKAGVTQQWNISSGNVRTIAFYGAQAFVSGSSGVVRADTVVSNPSPSSYNWSVIGSASMYDINFYNDKALGVGSKMGIWDTTASATASAFNIGPSGTLTKIHVADSTVYFMGSMEKIGYGLKRISGICRVEISKVKENAWLTVAGPADVCDGSTNQYLVWQANTNLHAPNYVWSKSTSTTPTATVWHTALNNIMTVSATSTAGCFDTLYLLERDTLVVTPSVAITANIDGPTVPCVSSPSKYILYTNISNPTYRWKFGTNPITGNNTNTYVFTPTTSGSLTGTVYAPVTGCYTTFSKDAAKGIASPVSQQAPQVTIQPETWNKCSDKPIYFYATGNMYHAQNYQWTINGVPVGQNNDSLYVASLQSGDTVKCVVTASSPNCFTSQTEEDSIFTAPITTIIPALSVSASANPSCLGAQVTYTATTTNTPNSRFEWYVNGVHTGAPSNIVYSYVPANGDVVTCWMVPQQAQYRCISADSVSQSENMQVLPILNSAITISGPAKAGKNAQVTITASSLIPSSSYTIEWKNNGSIIGTTAGNSITYSKGAGTDNITGTIRRNCYTESTSNVVTVAEAVGVNDVNNNGSNISVYPNPFRNEITITGTSTEDKIIFYDIVGKKIAGMAASGETTVLKLTDMSPGVYVLEVLDKNNIPKGTTRLIKQ